MSNMQKSNPTAHLVTVMAYAAQPIIHLIYTNI